MIWLTYKQHRMEFIISGIIFFLILVVLLVTGFNIARVSHQVGLSVCSAQHIDCSGAQNTVNAYVANQAFGNGTFYAVFQYVLLALPLFVGMFIGARLVAQEFEQGTYRLVWTQGIQWSHWLLTKSGFFAGLLFCTTGILYGVFIWWKAPVLAALSYPWGYQNYDAWGFVAIAYMLFAFALGVAVGSIVKKTVPAMAIILVVFIIIRLVIEVFLRPYLLPPLVIVRPASVTQSIVPAQSWVISNGIEQQGKPVSINREQVCSKQFGKSETAQDYLAQYNRCLASHGFQNVVIYQPADRFDAIQGIESGIYILLAILSLGIAFWGTRRGLT
jgi:ABC-type transport system involved in multi-copper enzyme maturation permease subunit